MPKRDTISTTNDMPIPHWRSQDDLIHLYHGDCREWSRNVIHPFADTIFADPPFNIDYTYDDYKDKMKLSDYLGWTEEWVCAMRKCLLLTGSLWVCSHAKYQAEIKVLLTQQGWHWQNTVIWHYTFGPQQKYKLTNSWVAIHHMTLLQEGYTYRTHAVRVPSARQIKYGDRRAKAGGKNPDNVWILDPKSSQDHFRPDQDAILQSRVCGTFKERTKHPCQMPVEVVRRCVRLTTPERGLVLDPFAGSGTTGHACRLEGYRHIGVELSLNYLEQFAIPRLGELSSQ